MTAEELVQAAHAADKEKRFPEAIDKAKAALKIEPGHERARLILAHALDNSGQSGEAAVIVDGMLREGPNRLDLLYYQAVLLRKAGRPNEALPLAERFVQVRPDSSEAHGHLGVVFVALGRAGDAVESLTRAAQLNPNFAPHRYNLALALIQLGRDSEAEPVLRNLLEMSPGFVFGHVTLGEAYLKRGAVAEAIAEARLAIAAQPDHVSSHLTLARGLTARAAAGGAGTDDAEAEQHIRLALALDPDSFVAHGMLGFALQEQGDFETALTAFETSLRLNARQGEAYYGLATCRKYAQDDGAYRDLFSNALDAGGLDPMDRAYVHYALGKLLEDEKDFEGALDQFDAANGIMFELRGRARPFDPKHNADRVSWVIETFSAAFLERQRGIGSSSELPLLVLGMIRSGTTLVEQILSSHPQVVGGGELQFWHENAGKAADPGLENLEPARVGRIADNYLSLLREIGLSSMRVTDKLPENVLYLGLIHALFPEARIVHCRRHPVDTCLSIYATPYSSPPDFVYDRANIVFAYRQYLRLMAHWRSVIPESRLLEVDYEALVTDREPITRQLIEFAGLEWDDACLRHERNDRLVKTSSRWQVRQPIYRTSVARWKNFEPWLKEFAELLPDEAASDIF